MRLLVLLFAIAMPVVAYFSNTGAFGPDSATISAMYPIVLLPAGYAFMIWGLIFLLDLAFAIWALTGIRKNDPTVNRVVPWAAAGFAMTAVWMPLYSMSQLWPCVLVIFAGMACMVRCALILSRDSTPQHGQWMWGWLPLSLHAGWMSLAAFLNIGQAIVAGHLLSTTDQLPWALVLLAAATITLLPLNQRMRGNIDYVLPAIWGLVAVYVEQSDGGMRGAQTAAWAALLVAALLAVQTAILRRKYPGGLLTNPARAPG